MTPENKEEAQRLRALWDEREHAGQAVFGEVYGIGNQSAVGQFLRGDTPLSLKAARGFAEGLGCQLADFSPRLAAEAAAIAASVPGERLSLKVAALAIEIDGFPEPLRERVITMCRAAMDLARGPMPKQNAVTQKAAAHTPLRHVSRRSG